MRSPSRKATIIIFVAILLLLSLSFVSAELNKRDPQDDPAPGGGDPAKGGEAKGGDPKGGDPAKEAPPPAPPAPAAPAAPAAGGKVPAAAPPAATPGAAPAAPAAGGKAPIAKKKTINPLTPPVQVQIREPIATKNLLYKIGKNITFKWNYTAEFADPPTAIVAMAQPQVNLQTYYTIATVALNATMQEVTWNTANEASLPMALYKLWICDERGILAPVKPGGLLVYSGLQFSLYSPQTSSEFCPACNSASISVIPLLFTIGLTLITIISFSFNNLNY